MNTWIIAGILVGLLVIGGIAVASAFSVSSNEDVAQITECSSCSGKCNAENNCGLKTCDAINGGTCNCWK